MSSSVVHRKDIYPQEYRRLIGSYQEWLTVMNYNETSTQVGPRKIKSFMNWLVNAHQIESIEAITDEVVRSYFDHLSTTVSPTTGRGLSLNYIRTYLSELRRFSRYLSDTNQGHIEVSIEIKSNELPKSEVFTKAQIERLYVACADDLLGIRDRAMLSVFYGCGLRRNEGANLAVKDVQFNRSMLHVKRGKNYKERYVPMVGRVRNDLYEYLQHSRPLLANNTTGNWLFVGYRGGTVGGNILGGRFKKLKGIAQVNQEGSLHTLRHSIATHLLGAGMTLEHIAQFLGHSSLESTQIYTHLSAAIK